MVKDQDLFGSGQASDQFGDLGVVDALRFFSIVKVADPGLETDKAQTLGVERIVGRFFCHIVGQIVHLGCHIRQSVSVELLHGRALLCRCG